MATGESSAAVHGAAEAVATTGHDAAHAVARLTEEAATTQERLITAVESADRESATRLAASARGRFPVAPGVEGPAKNKVLTTPNPRHTIAGAKRGRVKGDNTVTLRGYERVLRADTERIAAGEATFDPVSRDQAYVVDGRSYVVKGDGTVFPVSGPGLVHLNRVEYAALHLIARAGGDVGAVTEFRFDVKFRDNPEAIAKAKAIYDGTYEP
jgi:hypothetical protein